MSIKKVLLSFGAAISLLTAAHLISTKALTVPERAYEYAYSHGYTSKKILTIVDFTKPANTKRLYVVDMSNGRVIMSTYVTHGSGSGNGLIPTSFSNQNNSHASSLGVYKTLSTYQGKHGRSLQLEGLEPGWNDHVKSRSVVIHESAYIGNGKTGRSWGCLAVPHADKDKLIDYIQNGTILVVYYPDKDWLDASKFLK